MGHAEAPIMNNTADTTKTIILTLVAGAALGVFESLALHGLIDQQANRITSLQFEVTQLHAQLDAAAAGTAALRKDIGTLLLKMDEHNGETTALAGLAYTYARGEKGYELCSPVCTTGTVCEQGAKAYRSTGLCDAHPASAKNSLLAALVENLKSSP